MSCSTLRATRTVTTLISMTTTVPGSTADPRRRSRHPQPRHRRRHRDGRRARRRRRRRGRRQGEGGLREWAVARPGSQPAGPPAAAHRRRDRGQRRPALHAGGQEQRAADHRDPRAAVPRAGVVPLQRGTAGRPAPGGPARRRPVPDLSGAAPARGVRHHHAVQPPLAHPGAQPVRRPGQRQHRRGQAVGADAADHPGAGRHHGRGRTARRRRQRGDRRPGRRARTHPAPRRRQDHADRRHRGGPRGGDRHGLSVRQGDSGTRRQDPRHRVRRRRPRGRRGGRRVRRVRRGRPILRRRFTILGAASNVRRSSSPRWRPAPGHPRR